MPNSVAGTFSSCSGGRNDGRNPGWYTPTVSGSRLYGITSGGGEANRGTVFTMFTDGKGFQLLHSFQERLLTKDGVTPQGKLAIGGSTLYGTTCFGGLGGKGTVYKIETDGSGFKVLHAFGGGRKDGDAALGPLLLAGSALYGMTQKGGLNECGTIFKLDCRGGGFALLHSFTGGSAGGDSPHGGLVLDADTLYGMTSNWKTDHQGTIFKVHTNGSEFQIPHEFQGGPHDGRFPYGSLLLRASALYGMTNGGGASDRGAVFKVGIDGSGFEIVHSFAGETRDGSHPCGDLVGQGARLYSMTYTWGAGGIGTVFSIVLPEPQSPMVPTVVAAPGRPLWSTCLWVLLAAVVLGLVVVVLYRRSRRAL
ncbi:MAG: choice-of-anchor tandem repeat GloVer-containing protein [Thermoguttaceae bacterium]